MIILFGIAGGQAGEQCDGGVQAPLIACQGDIIIIIKYYV